MIFGMTTFTAVHVLLSLVGIWWFWPACAPRIR
jgi:hypothetical protein